MGSPLGLFVQVGSLDWGIKLFGEPSNWFDKILEVFGQPTSPNHLETLILTDVATIDVNGSAVLVTDGQGITMLDKFKDYLTKFDYLFVAGGTPFELDIRQASSRSAHINFCRDASSLFIKYIQENNITKPIHWYILPEADLNVFGNAGYVADWKAYISEYINVMTGLSAAYDLNVPEFLLSPYFTGYPAFQIVRLAIKNGLRNLLTSVPRLRWLHVQDGVGREPRRHPEGTIGYPLTPEDVIAYYNNILREPQLARIWQVIVSIWSSSHPAKMGIYIWETQKSKRFVNLNMRRPMFH
jgi:hypothetical protein